MSSENTVRNLFLGFMVLFLLLGGAIFGVTQWMKGDSDALVALLGSLPADTGASRTYLSTIYGLGFAIGMISFNNSWMGFVGAGSRHRIFLYMFAGSAIVMIILEITTIALAATIMTQIKGILEDNNTSTTFQRYNATWTLTGTPKTFLYETDDKSTSALDSIQTRYECCGFNGYQDYYGHSRIFPVSCCAQTVDGNRNQFADSIFRREADLTVLVVDGSCPYNPTGTVIYVKGCSDKIVDIVETFCGAIIGTTTVGFCFQLVMVIMALYLAKRFPQQPQWGSCCTGQSCNRRKGEVLT